MTCPTARSATRPAIAPARRHALVLVGGFALGACAPSVAGMGAPDAVGEPPGDAAVVTTDGGGDAASPEQLGVLSLNLHCLKTEGTAFTTNAARFAAIAAAVSTEHIDVVLAQEVCVSATENAHTMLVAALANATGATWSSTVALAHRAWDGSADQADEYVAIFSRDALSAPRQTVHRAQGSLRRVMLGATVATRLTSPAGAALPVRVYTVHLDHEDAVVRAAQGREVASAAMVESDNEQIAIEAGDGAVALPLLVGGDFNARLLGEAPQALVELGFVAASGSAQTTRIDHVFSHRSAPLAPALAVELFEGAAAVSDHPGVLVRFVPAPPQPVRLTRVVASGTFPLPLSVRGDRAPLSWDRGWPAFPAAGAGVAVVTSEMPAAAFAYKFLRQDADWAIGGNVIGAGEADNVSTPSFP